MTPTASSTSWRSAGTGGGSGWPGALLADAFANARAHGATRCELSTDSRTGALGLYERVGMVVTGTWVHRAVDLRSVPAPAS